MSEITSLEPRLVWEQFDAITRVPRPSKKEGKIIDFLVGFAKKHNIEYKKDAVGNVVMRKPATPGFEGRPAVILQSHMDMVCEKNSDVEFDFDNDPIRTRIDGEWVPCDRFPVKGTLVHFFDAPPLRRRHDVQLSVRDGCGNTAHFKGTFYR